MDLAQSLAGFHAVWSRVGAAPPPRPEPRPRRAPPARRRALRWLPPP